MYTHLVLSTKNRRALVDDGVRNDLHAYLAGILRNLDCHPECINSVTDHVHILFKLARTNALSAIVKDTRSGSSMWIKTKGVPYSTFAWQSGYGAFSVGQSELTTVRRYIEDQQRHHHSESFQEEFRRLLKQHGIEFDERYVWD